MLWLVLWDTFQTTYSRLPVYCRCIKQVERAQSAALKETLNFRYFAGNWWRFARFPRNAWWSWDRSWTSKGNFNLTIKRFSSCFVSVMQKFVRWTLSQAESLFNQSKIIVKNQFHNVIYFIDGCHISIKLLNNHHIHIITVQVCLVFLLACCNSKMELSEHSAILNDVIKITNVNRVLVCLQKSLQLAKFIC